MAPRQLHLFHHEASPPTLREVAEQIRHAGVDGLTEAVRRADEARYQDVRVRSALTEAKGMPFRWALNPYRGCTHDCQYCYARKYQKHLELGAGDDFSTVIFVKVNLAAVLRTELRRPTWAHEPVAVGTATDPYQPIEGQRGITRECLEILADASTSFSVVTKGPLVVRDIDVFQRAARGAGCRILVSVPSTDEAACATLEPGTASPAQRLRAAKRLLEAGIDVGVLMMPLMPGITTSRSTIRHTIEAIHASGLRLVGASVGRLDAGVRKFFFDFLARTYPELGEGYRRLYQGSHALPGFVDEVKAAVAAASRI